MSLLEKLMKKEEPVNDNQAERKFGIRVDEDDWKTVAEILRTEYDKDEFNVKQRTGAEGEIIVTLSFISTLDEYSDILMFCGEQGIKRIAEEKEKEKEAKNKKSKK